VNNRHYLSAMSANRQKRKLHHKDRFIVNIPTQSIINRHKLVKS